MFEIFCLTPGQRRNVCLSSVVGHLWYFKVAFKLLERTPKNFYWWQAIGNVRLNFLVNTCSSSLTCLNVRKTLVI